ncbi:MAG: hypothetical protein ACKVS7_16255 [Gemmatimonadaceae bacterium]
MPSTALLSLTYTGAAASDFRVRVSLTSTERGLIGTTESPVVTLAGGPSSFLYNVRDAVFEWTTVSRNSAVTDAAIRNGQIPEGTYRACARVFVGTATTPVTEACADFSILQPDPPQLLSPSNEQVVVSTLPFFQWTPVLTPPSVRVQYEITVVELLGRQVPRAALESNIPVLRTTASTPFLIYPIDALSLERTKRYAWRVRAVDDEGRQLFRDGSQSEIWSFEMSDDLLRPVGKVDDLPDTLVLMPGVAQLVGVRGTRISRTETEIEMSGTLSLEFLMPDAPKSQRVNVSGLRAGYRGESLSLLSGRVRATVPQELLPASIRDFVTFAPLEFEAATGFRASASLRLPAGTTVPMSGVVQLTAGGLFGRLESAASGGTAIASVGRAPVQYAATSARLTLPAGRLEFGGQVRLFEQEVGCPASGPMEDGVVRLAVYCDPARGLRPDASATKSLLTFGTLSGSLGADFSTDTLGTDLRAPTVFSVLGEGDRSCAVEFMMVFARDTIRKEDEQTSCDTDAKALDFGWVSFGFRRLRLERLEYAPGGTLTWRALVEARPTLRGAPDLQLPTIVDARFERGGVVMPSTGSEQPNTSTSGYAELDGFGIVPRTMGFRGGTFPYARWLNAEDPGFEWGSGTSWVRVPRIPLDVSPCLNDMPSEVDTLIIARGVLDARLQERRWETGCRLQTTPKFKVSVRSLGGRLRVALDTVARATELPTVTGGAQHPLPDCGIPIVGCIEALNFVPLNGDLRITSTGILIGVAEGYRAGWHEYDLKVAKLQVAGGRLTLGADTAGKQALLYDGDVKVTFGKLEEKKEEPKTDAAPAAAPAPGGVAGNTARAAAGAATSVAGDRFSGDAATTRAKIDLIAPKLLDGRFVMKGPFKMPIGFVNFVIAEATLDTTGVSIDGRQRVLVKHTTATAKSDSRRTPPDSTYATRDDTLGVTFAKVRIDPETGDVAAGTISFDGRLALESSPLSSAIGVAGSAIGGAVTGGGQGALDAAGQAVTSTNVFGFTLADALGSFDPTGVTGNIRFTLPGALTMDASGMRINGTAGANVAFGNSQFDGASVAFLDGFAMRPAAARVTAGRAQIRVRDYPIAHLDATGWHVSLGELVQTILPDTLFLRDKWSAYIVLRDANRQLLAEVTETDDGPRLRTRPGTALRIVVPALQGTRATAPSAEIALDLTVERGTWRPVAGEVRASASSFNLGVGGATAFPFQLDSLVVRASRNAEPSVSITGRLDAWPDAGAPMKLALSVQSGGELAASVDQAFSDTLALVPGTSPLKFAVERLRFTAQGRFGSTFQWRVELPGRLSYRDAAANTTTRLASATFRLSATEAALVDFAAENALATLQLPGIDLRLGRVRAPTFRWDFAARRFDFELLFDVGLMIPALDDLELPEIRDVRVTPQGLTIPAFEMSSIPVSADADNPFVSPTRELRVGGFSVKALAYRVSEFRWGWLAGAPPPSLNFGVDLEFGVEDLPSAVEGQAARIALRALDVGITGGRLTGRFERIDIPTPIRTPIADIRGAFGSFRVAEGEVPDISIGVLADLRLPELLACPTAAQRLVSLESPRDTLFLASTGTLRGAIRDIIPRCPMELGPFDLQFGASTARFGYNASTQAIEATLDASATLQVPGDSPNETVSATGRIVLDLVNARVADASIAIAEPFFWAPDPANPFLRLVVNNASLTQQELAFGATGQLRTAEGAGVDVAFEDVAFSLNDLTLTSGRIRLTADAAVGIEIPDNGSLVFGVYPVTTPRGGTASARLVLPSGAVLDTAGFHVSGTATASLGFGGNDYASLSGEFANDFTIATTGAVAIRRGRINLRDVSGQLIAYADSVGFWPGNVFAVLPIPARLGLPAEDVGYVQLRDPSDNNRLLVETVFGAETVRLRTLPNQRVTISLPALANGGAAPTVQAEFDLVLNSRTMRPVSGAIAVEAAPGQSLIPLAGLPVAITQLGFAADVGGYKLKAGARAVLPGPLGDVDLSFEDLEITPQGLTGTVELGTYSEIFDPQATPIAEANLLGDTLAVALTGARLTLGATAPDLKISGGIRSALFRTAAGAPRTINLAAVVDQNGFRGTADLSDPETPIEIGVAELTLEGGGNRPALVVTASANEFAITLGGSLRLPDLAPGFSLGVEDFKIGSAGVSIPNVSVTAMTSTREFELFGARFALQDSTVGATQVAPAIAIAFDQGVMRFTLSGRITVLNNTTRFIGLQFGTDGAFAIQGASFISQPIDIIPNTARLVSARIASGALEFVGDVRLPAPFTQQAPQQLTVRIRPDGQVSGGAKIALISEVEGLASARTVLRLGVAAFHLRHLDVAFDFESEANTAVSVVADIYVQERQSNLLRFGSVQGGTVTPGLRIALNGDLSWGGISMPNPITLNLDPVKLTFTNVTTTTSQSGFEVSISGGLGLKLDGASGELKFRNVGFTSAGEVRVGQATFDGGTFEIQKTLKVAVGKIAWSDSDTSIYVPIARPPNAKGEIVQDSTLVPVANFIDFGATVDIAGVFGGGVKRMLVYVAQADATTHLLIEDLTVTLPGVIDFKASLSYDQLVDGFDMALSTQGTLLSAYRIGLVGVMGQRAGVFRAGLFLRTSVTVPIIPGIVTLTEVGGGLFVNPTANDLLMVKSVAGLNGPSANKIGMPPAGKFAVMLYAGIEVAGSNGVSAAQGKVMVTITDKAFQINGTATFFKMEGKLTGDLAVQVGWDPTVYVRGAISLELKIPKTVTGLGEVQFYAGNNVFAVKGNVDLMIVETINAYAEVIVVPSGFTANLGLRIQKATSVVAVDVGGNLRIWYRPSTDDLGAYVQAYGKVTLFSVPIDARIVAALVVLPELAIYGQGTVQLAGADALKAEVWIQYTSRGLEAGLGRSEELAAVLANAEQIAADLEAEADAILAGIGEAERLRATTPVVVSEASLAAAYNMFQRADWLQMFATWVVFRWEESERRGGFASVSSTDFYTQFYQRTLQGTEAAADTAIVRQLREEAQQKLTVISGRRQAVEARIQALRLELDAAEAAAEFLPPEDPVTRYESGSPSFVEGPVGRNGKATMTLINAPQFELDDRLAATSKNAMTSAQAVTAARAPRLRAQIKAVEDGLTTVRAATSATDPSSFASYTRLHADALEAIEHQHAANVDFRMRRRSWAQAKLDTLAAQRQGVETRMQQALTAITTYRSQLNASDALRRYGVVLDLDSLARFRARSLKTWSRDDRILDDYDAAAASFRTSAKAAETQLRSNPNDGGASGQLNLATQFFQLQAVTLGMNAWWGVANAGLLAQRDSAQLLIDAADNAARPIIRAMRDMHGNLTRDLDSLNVRQADLYGVLHDLYDQYIKTYGNTDTASQRFSPRRADLLQMLMTPAVVNPRVMVTDFGYLSLVNTTWQGTHPRGVYEYLAQDGADSLLSVGAQGVSKRWFYTTNQAGGTEARNQALLARGGAGFTGRTVTPYTITFARGSAGNPVTQVAVPPVDLTPPTTPVVEFVGLMALFDATSTATFWTGDSSRVVARWSASDPQSGVAEYEYRVVSWPLPSGATDPNASTGTFGGLTRVGRVQPGTFTISEQELVPWTSAGGRTNVAIQGLNLPTDRMIHVQVRAKNGAGVLSGDGVSPGLRYDHTPPFFPPGASLVPPSTGTAYIPSFIGMSTYVFPPALSSTCGVAFMLGAELGSGSFSGLSGPSAGGLRPVWDGRLVTVAPNNSVVGGGASSSLQLYRPTASDPETGISGMMYRVDTVAPTGPLPEDRWSDIISWGTTFTANNADVKFGRPLWISLVAINSAGRRSAPVTHGPVTITDPSGPSAPEFCADYSSGGFIAYMNNTANDPETGVRGYQLRIRSANDVILRDFPANGVVDWPATQANAGQGIRLSVPNTPGGAYSVELRAVNGSGVPGYLSRSGMVSTDASAPPVPAVSGRATVATATLTIQVANDPESGIAGVDIAFGSTPLDPLRGGTALIPYATYPAAVGVNTRSIPLGASGLSGQIYVYVRVRNGAGMLSAPTTLLLTTASVISSPTLLRP